MNLGNILGSNFDRPFAFQNNLVMNVADVISTYVYCQIYDGSPAEVLPYADADIPLILNELCFKRFKKVVQTVAYMPHFLSWVIIYSLAGSEADKAASIFSDTNGYCLSLRRPVYLFSP